MTITPKIMGFRPDAKTRERIIAEQTRMAGQGYDVSQSAAIKSLIARASAATETADGDPAIIESKVFATG